MRHKALFFAAVLLAGTALVSAEQPEPAQIDSTANSRGEFLRDATLTTLEIDHELWLEAQLAGHREQAAQIEKELFDLMSRDLYAHQERVREMAKQVLLGKTDAAGDDSAAVADSVSRQALFQKSISALNAKEALHRSMRKTDAFSNKYRLLGDYIDLLRRELDMPRPKMASSKAALK